jgi:tetratricopeptide (TPR) repeat protein/tRNA A-37 threonylcarbamoyl transferase component Bud32
MDCLDNAQIVRVIERRLGDRDAARMHQHVDGCGRCRALMVALVGGGEGHDAHLLESTAPALGGPPHVLPAGTQMGRYVLGEPIGTGAMGTVYRARDPQLGRSVALKMVRRAHFAATDAPMLRARLLREAQAMARISHPNVVVIYDVELIGDELCIAMEHIDGCTLRQWLGRERAWPEIVAVFAAAARGLAAAHHASVVHRDFKPDNVLMTASGRVVVTDFGLARDAGEGPDLQAMGGPATVSPKLTSGGALIGTPNYMSPEQVDGKPADARSDQFAFGVALWEALYGRRPFAGESVTALREAMTAPPRRPAKRNRVPAGLARIARRTLAVDPADRFPSMTVLADALEKAPRARRRLWTAASALALLACAIVAARVVARRGAAPAAVSPARKAVAVLRVRSVTLPGQALEASVEDLLGRALGEGGQLRGVSPEALTAARATLSAGAGSRGFDPALVRAQLGADYVVTGTFEPAERRDQLQRLDLVVLDLATGGTVGSISARGVAPTGDLVARAAGEVRGRLGVAAARPASAGSSGSNPAAERAFAAGVRALQAEDPRIAQPLLEEALRADPQNPRILAALAELWHTLGQEQKAIDASARALSLAGPLPQSERLPIEAHAHEYAHAWSKAAEIHRALWVFFPDEPEHGLALAEDLSRAGRVADALAVLEQLRTTPASEREPGRSRLLLTEARIQLRREDHRRAQGLAEQALAGARSARLTALGAEIELVLAKCAQQLSKPTDALAACDRAEHAYRQLGNLAGVARAMLVRASVYQEADQIEPKVAALAEVERIYKTLGSIGGLATLRSAQANHLKRQGKSAEARQLYQDALRLHREAGDIVGEANDLQSLAGSYTDVGDYASADPLYREAAQMAASVDDQFTEAQILINLSINLQDSGHIDESAEDARRAVDLLRAQGNVALLPYGLDQLAMAQQELGQLAVARRTFEEAIAARLGMGWPAGMSRYLLANLLFLQGEDTSAERFAAQVAEEASGKVPVLELQALEVLAWARIDQHHFDAAAETLASAEASQRAHPGMVGPDEVADLEAVLKAEAGDVDGGLARLAAAQSRLRAHHSIRPALALAAVAGRIELAHGRDRAGRAHLAAVAQQATAHHMTWLVQWIARLESRPPGAW